jgi:serine/threonine protein kinase
MIGRTISHFKILKKLDGEGFGVVSKARDLNLDCYVALKFLHPELTLDPGAKGRVMREAKVASGLDQRRICAMHEIGEARGSLSVTIADTNSARDGV